MRDFSDKFLNVLRGTLKGLNLTNILDPEEFFQKQIMDSIAPMEQSEYFKNELLEKKCLIDIGFGGGFPLLPLAHCFPEIKFYGIESKLKKVNAVKIICEELNIKNVKVIHKRLENILFDKDAVLTFKAVGKISDYTKLINFKDCNLSANFYKGDNLKTLEPNFSSEILPSWKLIEEKSLKVKGAHGRILVSLKNQNVPHGTFMSKESKTMDLSLFSEFMEE